MARRKVRKGRKIRTRKPRVARAVGYQKGRSNVVYDRRLKAMKPGRRISRSGREYFETRRNRSDLEGGV